MFSKALRKSTEDENLVLEEAEALRDKNYSVEEIYGVLAGLRDKLIQDRERDIVAQATEEFEKYL
jgi:hypothetical protein